MNVQTIAIKVKWKNPQFARKHSRKQESNQTAYFIYRYVLAIDVPGEDLLL